MCDSLPDLLQSVAASAEGFPSVFLATAPLNMGLANLEAWLFFFFFPSCMSTS